MTGYHPQTGNFLGAIMQNIPQEISADVMQGWISNPTGLRRALRAALCPPEEKEQTKGVVSIIPTPVLRIDRSQPFDSKFIGPGWSIWRGPANGNGLEGDEDQDVRALALTEIDFSKVDFEHCLKGRGQSIKGETKITRLKERQRLIRMDAKMAQTLWEEPGKKTLEWLRINRNITWFDIPGTILRSPHGIRYLLFLCWSDGGWGWDCYWLGSDWYRRNPSLVLAE
jgi:hypothetical protein